MTKFASARAALEGIHELILTHLPDLDDLRNSVTLKNDGTPVTAADIFLEEKIEIFLRNQLDDLTFIGEERPWDAEADPVGWVAVVDPIDGTENFASSLPQWGVSVSIFYGPDHIASMINLPDLNQRILTGDALDYKTSRITAFSSSINNDLAKQIANTPQARLMGAAVYNMYGVITGRFARFVNPVGAYSWDLLAGLQLAREHNCEVFLNDSHYTGSYLKPGRRYRVDIRQRQNHNPR